VHAFYDNLLEDFPIGLPVLFAGQYKMYSITSN